jgi:hypothetical protein
VILIVKAAPIAYREIQAQHATERERLRALIARGDRQHRQVMAGDERGICGDYAPMSVVGPA